MGAKIPPTKADTQEQPKPERRLPLLPCCSHSSQGRLMIRNERFVATFSAVGVSIRLNGASDLITKEQMMRATLRLAALALCLAVFAPGFAAAQNQPPPGRSRRHFYTRRDRAGGPPFLRHSVTRFGANCGSSGQPLGPAERVRSRTGRKRGLRRRSALRRRQTLHKECRRPPGVLGRPIGRLRLPAEKALAR